jgi:hypothetical protein
MQELSCAPRVTLVCGARELDWALVSAFLADEPYFDAFHTTNDMYGSNFRRAQITFQSLFKKVKLIEDQRAAMRSQRLSSLLDVLARFRHLQSTDPRDKVYALLGLTDQGYGIPIDYSKSMSAVYQDMTLELINISGNLDIICQNPFEAPAGPAILRHDWSIPGQADDRLLPSWVSDFSCVSPVSVLFAQRGIFNAGKSTCKAPKRLIGRGGDVIVLRGCTLGCVGPILQRDRKRSREKRIAGQARARLPGVLAHSYQGLYVSH